MKVDDGEPGHMLLAASDGNERVLVAVLVSPRGPMPDPADENAAVRKALEVARERHPGFDRYDAVLMLVVAPDRALLRHCRDALGEAG